MRTIIKFISIIFIINSISYSQWVQQNLPVSGQIDDLAFLNKDTGFAAMGSINKLLRTINGGTNWEIIRDFRIYQLEKIDTKTLYAINYNGDKLYRTFDGGTTWDSLSSGGWCGISFINKDIGWASSWSGIYKTTNAGISYNFLSNTVNCGKIVFLKENYEGEYFGTVISSSSGALFKSTNSGVNWVNVPNPLGAGYYNSITFINKDTGWCYFDYNIKPHEILFTTNSGLSWIIQYIDSTNSYSKIHFENNFNGWAGPTNVLYRIFATNNGGNSWGTQVLPFYYDVGPYKNSFVDSIIGWIGGSGFNIAKTTNGGGAITYIGIEYISLKTPASFKLNQNFPNPFNPSTTISFSITKESFASLKIYDVTGKEILMVFDNKFLIQGNYKAVINLNNINVPSGVYFYTLSVYNKSGTDIFRETKKMLYLK